MPLPPTATGLFSSDPSEVRDLTSTSIGDFFNQHVIPRVGAFDQASQVGGDAIDLDGEDEAASLRRQRQTQLGAEQDIFQVQQDEALFARRRGGAVAAPTGTPSRTSGRAPSSGGGFLPTPTGRPSRHAETENFSLPTRDSEAPQNDGGGILPPKGAAFMGTADTSKGITSFVKQFEGFNSSAYDDFGQTSIGYGTKARKGESSISKGEADRRLGSELTSHRNRVLAHNKKHKLGLKPHEIDALTSFDYNTGRLNQLTAGGTRSKKQIAQKMLLYNKAGGKTLRGLTRRRKAESLLFTKGPTK